MAVNFKLPERSGKQDTFNAPSPDHQITQIFDDARREISQVIRTVIDDYGKNILE